MRADALIIGGGIAGLSAGLFLARTGRRVTVLEREERPFLHASGRNAAIFRHAEPSATLCTLARRSRALLDELVPEDWLDRRGGVYLARAPQALAPFLDAMREAGVPCELLTGDALARRLPVPLEGAARAGVWSPDDGLIDLDAVRGGLLRALCAHGVEIATRTPVESLLIDEGRASGVRLASGETRGAPLVVLAAGAFAADLAARASLPLPLVPVRRHLFLLEGDDEERSWPVLWRLEDEVYLRGDPEGLLASPCDEEPFAPCLPPVDEAARPLLDERLVTLTAGLGSRRALRAWACLRTRAPDGGLVVGKDPRAEGLLWLAGLAGYGMTVGLAAAEQLLGCLGEGPAPMEELAPARLLGARREA